MKFHLSIYEKFFLAAIPILLVVAMYAFRSPRYPLLDAALKHDASNPHALAEVLRWDIPPGAFGGNHILFDVQHQALLRLLDLQEPVFRQRIPAAAEKCTGADSPGILPLNLNASGETFQIVGTPSLDPDYQETEGGYYSVEAFTFTEEGRLVSRRCVTDRDWEQYDKWRARAPSGPQP